MVQLHSIDRRALLRATLLGGAAIASCTRRVTPTEEHTISSDDLSSSRDLRSLAKFPEKDPLILLTDRPPQLETPLHYFREDLTPNEAHFVRWHLAGLPVSVDLKTWRLEINGNVAHPLNFSFDDLQHKFEPVSLVALNQCSGNGRSLFEPRVPGGQWRNGAMSNAKWTGVRLKEILTRARVRPKTVEVSFRGLDKPPLAETPAFEKSLPIDVVENSDVLVAYAMNDKPLPMLNGYPARIIVPGWYATYWVKSLSRLTVRDTPLHNFWMDKAYRIPNNKTAQESPTQQVADTVPINRMAVHAIFVAPEPGETVKAKTPVEVQGLATDSGSGIKLVEVSVDNGASWKAAKLDPELGRYSWRRWRFSWTPSQEGSHRLQVRTTTNSGEGQVTQQWNHSGYQRSTIEHMDVQAI